MKDQRSKITKFADELPNTIDELLNLLISINNAETPERIYHYDTGCWIADPDKIKFIIRKIAEIRTYTNAIGKTEEQRKKCYLYEDCPFSFDCSHDPNKCCYSDYAKKLNKTLITITKKRYEELKRGE